MKLKVWELALIIALLLTLLCGAAAAGAQNDLAEKLVRLHVVAHSDSEEDQALKLEVRDKILSDVTELLGDITDRDKAAALIQANIDKIIASSSAVVKARGYEYNVTASIAVEEFPTRDYDSFSLPAGEYTSLRVVIGEGQGHNWWCVIFPPLCMSAATDLSKTKKLLTDEQIKLISSDEPEYVFKFKSIELFETFKLFLGL